MISIHGKEYASLVQACADSELNVNNLKYSTVYHRIAAGKDIESAFNKAANYNSSYLKNIVINGKTYRTLKEACKDKELNIHGISYDLALKRFRCKEKLEDIFKTPKHKKCKIVYKGDLVIKGKNYVSLAEACNDTELNKYNLRYNTVFVRLKRGVSLDSLFDKKRREVTWL